MSTLPHAWTLTDVVALSRIGRMDAHDRIALISTHAGFSDALEAIGALELDTRAEAERICNDAVLHKMRVITWFDSDYPDELRAVPAPPLLLYVRGTLPSPRTSIAVVGTRSCTAVYGKPVTDQLVRDWVEAGCSIVSGLASGVDILAHQACLRGGGITAAVIASGAGRISPKAAQQLADQILDQSGCVVSEHPWHVAALPPYFPARNRIIVGMSAAVVVVESKERGGALITASIARAAQRPLWAVPGPITSTRSIGTNRLLADGHALPCLDASDVLATLPIQQNRAADRPLPNELTPFLEDAHRTLTTDEISVAWNCSVSEVGSRMLLFELDGFVEQVPGSQYRLL